MKKIVLALLIATLFSVVSAFAQDVILKTDGTEINAKVLEITDRQVKYKDIGFIDGPTRNIDIFDVFMITYENGKKEVFSVKTSPATPTTRESANNTFLNSSLKTEFDKIGNDDVMMLNFFKENNFGKYSSRFEAACRQRNTGNGLLGAGIGLVVAGAIWTGIADQAGEYGMTAAGGISAFVGAGLIIASIPVSAGAGVRKKNIKNDFAEEYFGIKDYTYQPKLNFGQTSNGLGLTLNF